MTFPATYTCPTCERLVPEGILHNCPGGVVDLPKKRQFVRIVTKQGFHYDMEKPDDFAMFAFVVSIRSNGYLLNEMIYQPMDEIATIFLWSEDNAPNVQPTNVITFPLPPKGAA